MNSIINNNKNNDIDNIYINIIKFYNNKNYKELTTLCLDKYEECYKKSNDKNITYIYLKLAIKFSNI